MGNNVVHPEHYNQGNIECIDAIKESMSHEAYLGFLKGNAIKYLWRYEGKNKPVEDLEKAQYYIGLLVGELGEKPVIDQIGKSVSEIYRDANMLCNKCMLYDKAEGKCTASSEFMTYCKKCDDYEVAR